jgi:hypothetical protein
MKAYKFLAADGLGMFSRYEWPLPNGGPGAWVESEVVPCRSGIHACRPADLPYWVAPALYEIELDGQVEQHEIKVVARRGRLIRRIDDWNDQTRQAYSEMCIARARELAAAAPEPLDSWAPAPDMAEGPALLSFIAARIAEQLGGADAYVDERRRQSAWLVERLSIGD